MLCCRQRCELCPSRDGALKRTDQAGWAHVVCALYIPEVRFGNVTTMEPIILQLIPPERFHKVRIYCSLMVLIHRTMKLYFNDLYLIYSYVIFARNKVGAVVQ